MWIAEDVFPQSCSSAPAKIIGFTNRKCSMRCTRQPWTTLGRIERDFGKCLNDERRWKDRRGRRNVNVVQVVALDLGSKLFTVLVIIMCCSRNTLHRTTKHA